MLSSACKYPCFLKNTVINQNTVVEYLHWHEIVPSICRWNRCKADIINHDVISSGDYIDLLQHHLNIKQLYCLVHCCNGECDLMVEPFSTLHVFFNQLGIEESCF